LLDEKVKQTNDVKTAIDILATQTALKQEETLEKVVTEKQEELRNDAEAKRIQAETEKISKEVEKVKQEKEKELAELDKEISAKQKEVEKLKADSDKAQAFFDSNEDILSCIGIRSKKTLKVMYALMIPATIIFILIRFIALPLTIGGKLVEILIEIIGGICKAITNSALKIIISIFVILLLAGGGFCAYYFGGQLIL
jgi:Rps23 Pro-64 3,4-dihydroxylase Tpa1-like proline 4-hydroxylase